MSGQLADRWGGEEGYVPYVFSEEVQGVDDAMKEKIRAFTYDAGVIVNVMRVGIPYSGAIAEAMKVMPIRVNGNYTNLARCEINGRMYLIEISPLNY